MNKENQRIAIAEACGWRRPSDCARVPKHRWQSPDDGCCYNSPPDYLNDLNAMHEAEHQLIKPDQWPEYEERLRRADKRFTPADIERSRRCTIGAEAAQRAEATLKTIGKWEDDS